jgi:hypothetical protein
MNLLCPVLIQIIQWASFDTSRLAHRVWDGCWRSSHMHRAGAIRIIGARRVTRAERKIYEEG